MPVPPDDKVKSDKKKSDKPKKEESNKKDSKKKEVVTVDDESISLEKKDENWLGAKYVVVDVEEEMLDEITALHKLRFPSEIQRLL